MQFGQKFAEAGKIYSRNILEFWDHGIVGVLLAGQPKLVWCPTSCKHDKTNGY